MDNVLLIDFNNAVWRASIRYGKPVKHVVCTPETHNDKHTYDLHCACGSPWDESIGCFGEQYYMVYNFFRNLRPLIEKFKPNKCFVVLEGHPKARYDLYPEYKANRIIKTGSAKQEKKDELFVQSEMILKLLALLPITICRAAEYEADDLISELAEDMKEENITILSSDTDFIQILQRKYKSCNLYNPIKKEFAVAPEYHYVAWKALAGDKGDHIPMLLTKAKALKTINNPKLLKDFLEKNEENRFLFNRNRELIEFMKISLDNIEITEGLLNLDELKNQFNQMAFESITNENSWIKFSKTFDCLSY